MPRWLLVEIWESDYFQTQRSTNPPHFSLCKAPLPTGSRHFWAVGSAHVELDFVSHFCWTIDSLRPFTSHPSAFQFTKFCSYCLLFSSSFPLGPETFKNHFRIVLWGTWQGVKAFNLPSLHGNLQIPSALCWTMLLPLNPLEPTVGVSASLHLNTLCSSPQAGGCGWDQTTNLFLPLSVPLNFYSVEIILPILGRKVGRALWVLICSHERDSSVITLVHTARSTH